MTARLRIGIWLNRLKQNYLLLATLVCDPLCHEQRNSRSFCFWCSCALLEAPLPACTLTHSSILTFNSACVVCMLAAYQFVFVLIRYGPRELPGFLALAIINFVTVALHLLVDRGCKCQELDKVLRSRRLLAQFGLPRTLAKRVIQK
jgi:hypothetical protein